MKKKKKQTNNIVDKLDKKVARLEKGYKKFLNDFKILLGFNALQIILNILVFFSVETFMILATTYFTTTIVTMFAYFKVIGRIK